MADDLVFDDSGLDQWTDEESFEVTRDGLAKYAAATNDRIEAHLRGDVGSLVFAIVPVFESMMMPAVDVLPVELIPRVVHGEQDFRFYRPIRPGYRLRSRGKMIGYESLENGTRAAIKLECRDEAGQLVNEQYLTTFVRGFNAGKTVGELSPGHKGRRGLHPQRTEDIHHQRALRRCSWSTPSLTPGSARGSSCWDYSKAIFNSPTPAPGCSPIMPKRFTTAPRAA